MTDIQFTGKDVMLVLPYLLGLVGVWVRIEVRLGKQDRAIEDLSRIVLNGHGKKPQRKAHR